MKRLLVLLFIILLASPSHAVLLLDGNVPPGCTASAGVLTCTGFAGDGSGLTGVTAGNMTVYDTNDTTAYVGLWDNATGSQSPKTDGGLTYNAGTGTLAATAFSGPLTGNASTASALAANGANCSAGQAPLGVDAAGAVESCFAVQASDATLTALAGLSITEGSLIYGTAADTFSVLAKGGASSVLRTNAGATAPEWSVGFTVDADGDVTAKSYSTTRGDAAQYIELYEATSDGDSKATIAVPAKGTGLAGDVSITVSQSLALTGTMTDGKYCTYASSGNVISCNSTPSDVDSVGDCTSGACLDGTSDGGGYIALYDGDSNKVTVDVANIDADATLLLGKTYTDGKWCTYSTTTGFNCNEDAPAGAGDVTKVGDCTDGDCYDGSSDGGTYWSLYDGTSSYLKGLAGVRTLTLSSGVADSEDLTVTLGSNDNTVSLSSSTGAVNLSANAFTISSNGLVPDAADGATLGSATAEWSDLFLADGAVINLGADQDVQLTHVADTGVLLGDGDGTATTQLQLGDSGTYINQPADGYIGLTGDTGVRLKADDEDLQLTKTGANGITLGTSTDVTTLTTALNFASTGNISGKIPMISKSANYTLGTDSAQEAYGYMVWLDGNATTLTLPAVAAGMSVCAYSADATVKYVDPNGSDGIRNGATRDTDGDAIKSAAALGDFVCLVGDGADGWTVLGKSGTWASQ